MKAWQVGMRNSPEDGCILVHAETSGKAKKYVFANCLIFSCDCFTDLYAHRCKELDDKPFSVENAETVLVFSDSIDEDGDYYGGDYCTREQYINECRCPICKGAQQ